MRKTRSQTRSQAENARLASSACGSRSCNSSTSTGNPSKNYTNHIGQSSDSANASQHLNTPASYVDPSKLKEYEDMVNLLRRVELQQILSFLSISFAGRKIDLQRRVVALLHSNFDLLSLKIREVYSQFILDHKHQQQHLEQQQLQQLHQQQQQQQQHQQQQGVIDFGPPAAKRMFSQMQLSSVTSGGGGGGGGGAASVLSPMGSVTVPPGNVQYMHSAASYNIPPLHPDVRLKKLAFFDVLGTLVQPSTLVPRNGQRLQEALFYFTLTPGQATEIAQNRDVSTGSRYEYPIQVQVRFCLLETSCDQEDCFPPSVVLKVNNKVCQLPNIIPTNRPNVEPKRPPRPVNVTGNVKLSPTVTNTVTVQWCPDYTRGYCVAVYLVKKLTSQQLLQRMKSKGIKPADYTRALIKEKLTEDADSEIATTMLKVSLNCPVGKCKMSIPCRSSTCSHLQCFDASLYLQMNERKPTWLCPVCDQPALYDNLVIDGYFQEVIASSLLRSDDSEIQLHKDGSWSTHNLRNEAALAGTENKTVQKVEVISDDVELITTEDSKPVKAAVTNASAASAEQPTSTTGETVDLTLSDSDDDMPLAKRRPSARSNTSNGQPAAAAPASSSTSTSAATTSTSASAMNGVVAGSQPRRSSKIVDDESVINLDSSSEEDSANDNANGLNDVSSTATLKAEIVTSTENRSADIVLNPYAVHK